jgi:hypothetical protein
MFLDSYLPMALAGLVGGFGLSVCYAIAHRTRSQLIPGTIIGAVSALPFGLWLEAVHQGSSMDSPAQRLLLKDFFEIWQAAMGTYFCLVSILWRKPSTATR